LKLFYFKISKDANYDCIFEINSALIFSDIGYSRSFNISSIQERKYVKCTLITETAAGLLHLHLFKSLYKDPIHWNTSDFFINQLSSLGTHRLCLHGLQGILAYF